MGLRKKLEIPNKIKEFIEYNPQTGDMYWKQRTGSKCKLGKENPIRHKDSGGHYQMVFERKTYLVSRIAWFMMTGEQPNIIDHINGDKVDNRFSNLRNTSLSGNARNAKRHRLGMYVGVIWDKSRNKWIARIPRIDTGTGKELNIGRFDTAKEAKAAIDTWLTKKSVA